LAGGPQQWTGGPAVIPGGLGDHKWADRRLLASLARPKMLGPDEHLLIEDANGDVLETSCDRPRLRRHGTAARNLPGAPGDRGRFRCGNFAQAICHRAARTSGADR
jgi:hypothetical protein